MPTFQNSLYQFNPGINYLCYLPFYVLSFRKTNTAVPTHCEVSLFLTFRHSDLWEKGFRSLQTLMRQWNRYARAGNQEENCRGGIFKLFLCKNQLHTASAWHRCWCDLAQPCPNTLHGSESPATYPRSTMFSLTCDWGLGVWFSLWNSMVNKTKWMTLSQHPSTHYRGRQDGFDISNTVSDSRKRPHWLRPGHCIETNY